MPSECGDHRKSTKPPHNSTALPPEQEQLPCPRCDSTNTKFCYYNNYNFSQPRHFCKSCRRYWTHGGTLRDIPVGGGSRKNAKRSRTTTSSAATPVSISSVGISHFDHPLSGTQIPIPFGSAQFGSAAGGGGDGKHNVNMRGSFTSLLNTQGSGFLALSGFGLGLGPGFEDMGFGLSRGAWPFPAVVDGGAGGGSIGGNGGALGMGNTWQLENGEGGFVGGDCFSWPDLAISTPGNGLK